MDDLNNGQTQGVLANMLQHLQEATPDSEKDFTLREEADDTSTDAAPVDGDVIELGGEFDYEGYQVVRRAFFAHTNEPSITFNNYKVYVNSACLGRFPSVDYVQVLVNSDSKILAKLPSLKEDPKLSVEFYSTALLEGIYGIFGVLDRDYNYRLTGEIDQVNRVAYFSMRSLKRIERRKPGDGQGV